MITLKWDITYKCNLMCQHCINGNYLTNDDNEITYEDMVNIINKINDNVPVTYIHFLGGEPLMHPDFLAFLDYLETKKIKFGFNTNGLLLNEKNFDHLKKLKYLNDIILSIEGPNAELNDKIRGKNIFNILMKRIRMISDYKKENTQCMLKIIVNTVVTSMNYNKLDEMIDLCVQENVDSLQFLEFVEEGNGVGKNYSLNDKMFLEAISILAKRFTAGCGKLEITPKFCKPLASEYAEKCLNLKFPKYVLPCGAGSTTMYLDNKGIAYSCDGCKRLCAKGYNLLQEDFSTVWESDDFKIPFSIYYGDEIYKKVQPCNECKYLGNICIPCYLGIKPGVDKVMQKCQIIKNLINEVD